MFRKPTGTSLETPSVPRKSISPSAFKTASLISIPRDVATAPSVTPAQATSASRSMSPEQASWPVPPVAGCSPAVTRALCVSILQLTSSPRRACARSVTRAALGCSRYCSFNGAWIERNSSVFKIIVLSKLIMTPAAGGSAVGRSPRPGHADLGTWQQEKLASRLALLEMPMSLRGLRQWKRLTERDSQASFNHPLLQLIASRRPPLGWIRRHPKTAHAQGTLIELVG